MIKIILGVLLVALGIITGITFIELWLISPPTNYTIRTTFWSSFILNAIGIGKLAIVIFLITGGVYLISKSKKS